MFILSIVTINNEAFLLVNASELLKKCFFGTTRIVISATGSNLQYFVNELQMTINMGLNK